MGARRQAALSGMLAMTLLAPLSAYNAPSGTGGPARPSVRPARALRGSLRRRVVAPARQTVSLPVVEEPGQTVDNTVVWRPPQRSSERKPVQRGFAERKPVSPASTDRTRVGSLNIPNLGIGTIAWTAKDDEGRMRIDSIAQRAREKGLDFFDTAERYGASPLSMIPAALAGVGLPVDKSYLGGDCESNLARWGAGSKVATKFTPTPWRRSVQDVVHAAEKSAERLGVQQLDLYQIHMPDIIQPFARFGKTEVKDEIYWDGLIECYKRGLVKNVGVSNYGPTMLARAQEHLAREGVPLASNQIAFNLLTRRQGSQATVDAGNALGIKTLAYYPLAMGLLTGKMDAKALRGKTDLRSKDLLRYLEGGKGGTAGSIPRDGVGPLVSALELVAASRGKTAGQVALNWIICKGAIPIPGASTVKHIDDNLGALGWRLSPKEQALLEDAADALSFDFNGSGFQTTDSKFVGYGFEQWRLD